MKKKRTGPEQRDWSKRYRLRAVEPTTGFSRKKKIMVTLLKGKKKLARQPERRELLPHIEKSVKGGAVVEGRHVHLFPGTKRPKK